jgi:hypothetical protein
MIVQTEDNDFARDITSKALINTNRKALEEYRAKKNNVQRIKKLEEDMDNVNSKLDAITDLLGQLINSR